MILHFCLTVLWTRCRSTREWKSKIFLKWLFLISSGNRQVFFVSSEWLSGNQPCSGCFLLSMTKAPKWTWDVPKEFVKVWNLPGGVGWWICAAAKAPNGSCAGDVQEGTLCERTEMVFGAGLCGMGPSPGCELCASSWCLQSFSQWQGAGERLAKPSGFLVLWWKSDFFSAVSEVCSVCAWEGEPREHSAYAGVPGGPPDLLHGHLPAWRELCALILVGSQHSKPYILWHALTFNHSKEKHTTRYPRAQWACLFSAPCILFIEVLQHAELKQTACDHCLGGGK